MALAAVGCADPAPPPGPETVRAWRDAVDSILASAAPDARARARVVAAVSIAVFEAHATVSHRTTAGQLNGLWSVPRNDGALDPAVAASIAGRSVIDALLPRGATALAALDSLVAAQLAARRAAGVSRTVVDRSVAHGREIGRAIASWAASDTMRTLVLRHARECLHERRVPAPVTQAGEPAPVHASDAAAQWMIAAIRRVDSLYAHAPTSSCLEARVRGRLRTHATSQ